MAEEVILGKTVITTCVDRDRADFFPAKNDLPSHAGHAAQEEWLTFATGGYHGLFETDQDTDVFATGEIIVLAYSALPTTSADASRPKNNWRTAPGTCRNGGTTHSQELARR